MKNRFGKLLCLFIISIFIIGFGGEKVKALYVHNAMADGSSLNFRPLTYFVYIVDEDGKPVYCINSSKNFPGNLNLSKMDNLVPNDKINGVISIINASSDLGLSDEETYYITQTAVWYYLHGTHQADDGKDGITVNFKNWVENSKYSTAWNTLLEAANNANVNDYSISIIGNNNNLVIDGNYLVSDNFSISAENVPGNFEVSIDNNSTPDACIEYNGSCTSTVEISSNQNFIIKVPKPEDASGSVEVKFNVKPKTNPIYYELETYGGFSLQGYQNVARVVSKEKELAAKKTLTGDYVNNTTVYLQKVDFETGDKVEGAILEVYAADNSFIGRYTTTGEGVQNPEVSLGAGEYELREIKAPEGYTLSSESVKFSVDSDGKVSQNGNNVDDATISMKNYEVKVKFKKVDENGNPISGIKFKIYPQDPNPEVKNLCAITDNEGLLTKPCSDSDYDERMVRPNSDGIYVLGKDFGTNDALYNIYETCESESCKGYATVLTKFSLTRGIVTYTGSNISVETSNDEVPIVTFNIKNLVNIEVSKVDFLTGDKIGGASLKVIDKSVSSNSDNVLAEWESVVDQSYTVLGIQFNHRYTIMEDTAPDGYVKMYSALDFEVRENGDVIIYEFGTDKEIQEYKSTNYELKLPNDYTKVQFSKVDAVSGEELPGAELKICTLDSYNASGLDCVPDETDWSWTSEIGKQHMINRLKAGTYYLIETIAPEGYVRKTSAQSFNVLDTGELQSVKMENELTKVIISKKDFTTGEEITGAHLKIIYADSREVATDIYGNKTEWDSEAEPHYIYGLKTGNYILIETIPADNYAEGMIIDGDVVTEYEFAIVDGEPVTKIDVFNDILKEVPSTGISTLNIFAIGALFIFIGYEIIKMFRRKVTLS